MLRAMSSYVYVNQRLHPGLLDAMARGGAQAIEVFCARQHFDYRSREQVRTLGDWFKQNPVTLHSLHSPMYSDFEWGESGSPPVNIADPDKRRRIDSMDEIKRALEVAEIAPFRFLVQHIGNSGEEFDARKFDSAMTCIEHLRAFAKPLGVTLLVENIPNELSTPQRLVEMLDGAHFHDVGVCFDLGHAHVMRNVASEFQVVADRIRSSHVHDNKGDADTHLWPGEGSIEWKEAMSLLSGALHAPPVLLEIDGAAETDVPRKMAAAFQMLESAATARQHAG